MDVPLLAHARSLGPAIARALDGTAVEHPALTGFLASRHDRFLNQLFAHGPIEPDEVVAALRGRPGFVWLEEPSPGAVAMTGMTAATTTPVAVPAADVVTVRTRADLDAWQAVYREVFGSDERGRDDWRRLHDALGPDGDRSLVLLLARVDGAPAATGGVFFDRGWAGLYCFTTRCALRGRGLGSALVLAAHETARERGVERALLHATPLGRPLYERAGYRMITTLSVLVAGV